MDKHWSNGEGLSRVAGAFFVVLGLIVIAFPDVLPTISGVDLHAPMKMDDMGDMPM